MPVAIPPSSCAVISLTCRPGGLKGLLICLALRSAVALWRLQVSIIDRNSCRVSHYINTHQMNSSCSHHVLRISHLGALPSLCLTAASEHHHPPHKECSHCESIRDPLCRRSILLLQSTDLYVYVTHIAANRRQIVA